MKGKKRRYVIANVIQTNYPLDGVYKFDKRVLYPCFPSKVEGKSEHKLYPRFSASLDFPLSNFVIAIEVDVADKHPMQLAKERYKLMGFSDEKATAISEHEYRMSIDPKYRSEFITQMGLPEGFESLYETIEPWKNIAAHFGGLQIDEFAAWLSCLTGSWMVPYCEAAGPAHARTIQYVTVSEEFNREELEKIERELYIKVDETKKGEFVNVGKRPNLSVSPSGTLKLPSDFHSLTSKLFTLEEEKRFLGACFAYQIALDNLAIHPTLSVIAFVSAIGALNPTPGKDDKKWFKSFLKDTFDKHLSVLSDFQKNLLKDKNLNEMYRWRSKFVHQFILGNKTYEKGLVRAMMSDIAEKDFKSLDFGVKLGELGKLINASLIQWLVEY